MTLRESIQSKHSAAEAHTFTGLLLSGSMSRGEYASYLANQLHCYRALESALGAAGLLVGIEGVVRSSAIAQDLAEVLPAGVEPTIHEPSKLYAERVRGLTPHQLTAHLYVRHMGDMYGGQMIKSKVPSRGLMYEFESRSALVAGVRAKLSDDLAEEANIAFDFILSLFDELAHELHLQPA
jgi:heme oxygenase